MLGGPALIGFQAAQAGLPAARRHADSLTLLSPDSGPTRRVSGDRASVFDMETMLGRG